MLLPLALLLPLLIPSQDQEKSTPPIAPKAAQKDQVIEPLTLVTRDELKISAYFVRADPAAEVAGKQPEKRPLLILLHGGNRTKERWLAEGFVSGIRDQRYHILALDIRGRGKSDAWKDKHPGYGVWDVEAALKWAATQAHIDADRIALVGSSFGANLATSGLLTQKWKVRTVVCFSVTGVAIRFLPLFPEHSYQIPSGLYLACTQEPERYDVLAAAEYMREHTKGASLVKTYERRLHAISMYSQIEEVPGVVNDWLRKAFQ